MGKKHTSEDAATLLGVTRDITLCTAYVRNTMRRDGTCG